MKKILISVLGLLLAKPVFAVVPLETLAQSGLRFIAKEQVAVTGSMYVQGEWPSWIESTLLPASVGVGKLFIPEPEPSAFTTASVTNQLAQIYLQYPRFQQIPRMIARAQPSFERYREGTLYNFYPPKMWKGVRVHQAAGMSLTPMWKGFTNIPQDADTTSTVYAAKYYANIIAGTPKARIPEEVLNSFSRYRDLHRRSHYYNRMYGDVTTGAFLTWQYDENDPEMPRYYFAEPEEGVRIPFNRNDIDCVVNFNVLKVLALNKRSDIPGRSKACEWLNKVSKENQYATCGIYYPNTYNFAHSASMVDKAGETCLRPRANHMVQYILRSRLSDGAWVNYRNSYQDRVHSTAYAMLALARFGDFRDQNVRLSMKMGANFLYRAKRLSKAGDYYWKGEIFFTDTAIARALVNWRSHSFTTAVVVEALLEAHRKAGWQPYKALDHKL